ncbi:branched-chain amino acid ABC transporter, amino acid-binding protein [Lachnospiraceae bacterium KM106-2]|nr:branched-chain amino acid ABC transporter, amino acid-binding protein [Lachnospiraceae bacterium KM106-2]
MRKSKLISVVVVVLLCLGLLSGCSTKQSSESKGKFVIGGLGPLSGSTAAYGTSVKRGAEIAIKEINDAGGMKIGDKKIKLELNFQDDEASEETVVSAYDTLMDQGIDALLGTVTSGACLAIVDKTHEDGILQITPSGSALKCTKNDNNFRLCFTDPLQGEMMAELAVKQLGYKNIAVIFNTSDEYSTGMKDAFINKVKELGGNIVISEAFVKDDVDFTTQLTKIKNSNAECIFVPTYYTEASYITAQAKEKGMNLPFLGGDGWDGILDNVTDKSSIEGAIFLSPFFASDPDEAVRKFVTQFKKEYKTTPNQFAADGYDTVYVMKAAAEKAGSTKSSDMIAAMTKIKVKGITGEVTFSKNGEPTKSAKYVEIKDGKYTSKK